MLRPTTLFRLGALVCDAYGGDFMPFAWWRKLRAWLLLCDHFELLTRNVVRVGILVVRTQHVARFSSSSQMDFCYGFVFASHPKSEVLPPCRYSTSTTVVNNGKNTGFLGAGARSEFKSKCAIFQFFFFCCFYPVSLDC